MTDDERRAIEAACTRLCLDFARHTDLRDPARCAALFTADAVYERRGERLQGRAAIQAAQAARAPERVTRHLVHQVCIDVHDGARASGYSVFTMYGAQADAPAPEGLPAAPLPLPPALVAEFVDEYLLTEEGWRIARRTGRSVFRAG